MTCIMRIGFVVRWEISGRKEGVATNGDRRRRGGTWVGSLVMLLALGMAGCTALADTGVRDVDPCMAVVEAFAEVWCTGEVDRLDELFTEGWARALPGTRMRIWRHTRSTSERYELPFRTQCSRRSASSWSATRWSSG